MYRLEDGKIVEHWGMNDPYTIAMQAGAPQDARDGGSAGRPRLATNAW
ncbi:MAG TPA: hypothetical protein VGR46_00585 [Candidatus Limnocylindria bacterium]|nr:hypothetical protein [Candidatus Limnocylindria bacterium]